MTGLVTLVTDWFIRVVVVISLIAHVFLAIFAGTRRREAYSVGTSFLWAAYQAANWATPYLLGNLTLGSTSLEQQLVELWLPFLVTQLGGPDNITAYSLEDNKLSLRLYASAVVQMFNIGFLMYKQFQIVTSKGVLFWASLVMVVVAAYKYLERVAAFWKADFGNMISSSSKKKQRTLRTQPCRSGKLLGNDKALLLAHELLDISKQAFADDYLGEKAEKQLKEDSNLREIFSVNPEDEDTGWDNMCKVVEMELSLMYDILYTKATLVHNWCGYAIRIVSPVVTTTVMLLFWVYNKQGQRAADVFISYSLMVVTLLLDVRWLLRAAASTWTYAYFNSSPRRWLHHEVCCTRWWRQLRHFVMSLDPWQLPFRENGGGYRLWSGTIGQYNLFDEVTHDTTGSRLLWLVKKLSLEDAWLDYKYSKCLKLHSTTNRNVKKFLFKEIQEAFNMVPIPIKKKILGIGIDLTEDAAAAAAAHRRRRDLDDALEFLPEFQELILIWHVTTEVFLLDTYGRHSPEEGEGISSEEKEKKYVKAIKAVSNYMAFLAAVRSEMLPGLKLRSLHQATREALNSLWRSETGRRSTCTSLSSKTGDKKKLLVDILRCWQHCKKPSKKRNGLYNHSIVLSDGIKFADLLQKLLLIGHMEWKETIVDALRVEPNSLKRFMALIPDFFTDYMMEVTIIKKKNMMEKQRKRWNMLEMLKLLLKSWARMLIYVSTRCSRDSHAKQLGRGCELTTVVWILSEHATIFRPTEDPDATKDDNFDNGMLQL